MRYLLFLNVFKKKHKMIFTRRSFVLWLLSLLPVFSACTNDPAGVIRQLFQDEENEQQEHKPDGKEFTGDLKKYHEAMSHFEAMELMALEVYDKGQNMSKAELLKEINDRGIYYWNECITLIQSMDSLDIPGAYQMQDVLLTDYCRLRLAQYKLIYRAIEEETDKYDDKLTFLDEQINLKIKELNKLRGRQ
jgi:hypothetical protein